MRTHEKINVSEVSIGDFVIVAGTQNNSFTVMKKEVSNIGFMIGGKTPGGKDVEHNIEIYANVQRVVEN